MNTIYSSVDTSAGISRAFSSRVNAPCKLGKQFSGGFRGGMRSQNIILNDRQTSLLMRASVVSSSEVDDEEEPSTPEELARFDPGEEDVDTKEFALAMAKVAWDLKGEDLLLLHVAPVVYWTRYMIFVTVFSRPQLNAILGKIQKTALEEYDMRPSATPSAKSSWELLDFGDCVIHVLTAEEREYYDLESFYAAAEEVYLPFDEQVSKPNIDWRSKI